MTDVAINSSPPACSLTPAEFKARRALLREQLLPHVVTSELRDLKLTIRFAPKSVSTALLSEFVEFERQCCGFLQFTLSPPGDPLALQITGTEGSEATLALFAESAGRHK